LDLTERIKNLFNREGKARSKFNSRLLILLALGIGLLTINSLLGRIGEQTDIVDYSADLNREGLIEENNEPKLAALLEQIRGVSNVQIYATLEDIGDKELAYDQEQSVRRTEEQDGGGGDRNLIEETSRHTYVILRDAQGREIPLVIRENKPLYRGVVVVADGVENPVVKAQVVEALRSVLGLPYHRISVLPRGN